MLFVEDVLVAGDGDENIANLGGFAHGHDAMAIHDRFDGFEWIDFRDDNVGAHALSAEGQTFTAPSVARDYKFGARHEHVGAAYDTIQGALAGAVAIVEHVLGSG